MDQALVQAVELFPLVVVLPVVFGAASQGALVGHGQQPATSAADLITMRVIARRKL